MQKTLILTFGIRPEVEHTRKWLVFRDAQEDLERRTLACIKDGDVLVAKHLHKNWDKRGSSSCPENSFWNIGIEGMRFMNLTVEYTNAHLPSPEPDYVGNCKMRNGECCFPIEIYDQVFVTSLPSQEKVFMSLNVLDAHADQDTLRRGFLRIQHEIEAQLKLTQTAKRLSKAYEAIPRNEARVRRFKNKLFLQIAKV
jgi:hypothetical protein